MNKKIWIYALWLALCVLSVWGCQSATHDQAQQLSPKQQQKALIDSLKVVMKEQFKEVPGSSNLLVLENLAGAYLEYCQNHPTDSLAAVYYFEAAQLYAAFLRKHRKAIGLFNHVYEQYPDFDQRPMALFMSANTSHDMGDTTTALQNFNKFIEAHPKHPFAKDARQMIRFIRMTPKQMEDFFNKKADSLSSN